jgi:hypothetical protein
MEKLDPGCGMEKSQSIPELLLDSNEPLRAYEILQAKKFHQ